MRLFLLTTLSICLFSACRSSLNNWGSAELFFPAAEQLATGVVNKYYFHYKSNDGYEKSTDIRYYQYRQIDEQRLSLSIFNPAFELTSRLILRMQEDEILVEDEIRTSRGETFDVEIEQNILVDWKKDSANYVSMVHYPYGVSEKVSWQQMTSRDSTLMGRPAKIISQQRKRHYQYPNQEDRHYQTEIVDTYLQGFGLFSRTYVFEDGTGLLELVEQMPLATFEIRSRKVPPRVAYIDPQNTLDSFSTFAPCNDKGQIYDYYNGDPDGHYRPGKKGLWTILKNQVNPVLLGQESGYLTFRFVINCVGEIGWFVTEEADLNFEIKTFPAGTVQHLFEIIRQLDDWQPSIITDEAIDVYAYLTLKLKDGEIVEILP